MTLLLRGVGSQGAASVTTTLNPSDKSANMVLSGGNLTGNISSGGDNGARATTSIASGKRYFEIKAVDAGTGAGADTGCGIATSSAGLTTVGATPSNAALIYVPSGNIWYNNANTGISLGTPAVGDVFCIALDMDNKRIWFRRNAGNWNNNASYDPSTNTGGISISSVFTSNAAYPIITIYAISVHLTANFGATAFAQSVPSGFAAWG